MELRLVDDQTMSNEDALKFFPLFARITLELVLLWCSFLKKGGDFGSGGEEVSNIANADIQTYMLCADLVGLYGLCYRKKSALIVWLFAAILDGYSGLQLLDLSSTAIELKSIFFIKSIIDLTVVFQGSLMIVCICLDLKVTQESPKIFKGKLALGFQIWETRALKKWMNSPSFVSIFRVGCRVFEKPRIALLCTSVHGFHFYFRPLFPLPSRSYLPAGVWGYKQKVRASCQLLGNFISRLLYWQLWDLSSVPQVISGLDFGHIFGSFTDVNGPDLLLSRSLHGLFSWPLCLSDFAQLPRCLPCPSPHLQNLI